ncbi:unnamed protein product [Adineta ricciae]|uniref:Uncharacterized protein n=1 Tax=Adineta ricciae TaxID=249248 RepID=A0A813SCF2_ADIRI|nr:unnamed protein product [Adineta ricciae]CAF0920346.1 unnamed protein product [Adineta ricciae]
MLRIRSDPRPSESNAIPSPGFHRIRRISVGSDKILYWIRWDPKDNNEDQAEHLARELMNSDRPILELSQIQALVQMHDNLRPRLYSITDTNPLAQRINDGSEANINTMLCCVENTASMVRIGRALHNEPLSHEAREVLNTEGGNLIRNNIRILSTAANEIRENTRTLQTAILENERTANDSRTTELIQQQIQITTNISHDPRQANQQIRELLPISERLQNRIQELEPNENDPVRRVAQANVQYIKYAAGVFLLGAAAFSMCAGVAYLAPIVATALEGVTVSLSGGAVAAAQLGIVTAVAAKKR